jgi:Xaa-Pro aminopeptidase
MKSDLDSLMQARNLDALLVTGPGDHNPYMTYLIGNQAFLTRADVIKKAGEEPVLFHTGMERDEAAKTGLPTRNIEAYRLDELIRQAGGDPLKAQVLRYQAMFQDLGIRSGRVGIYGLLDAGVSYAFFTAFQQTLPEITLVGEVGDSVFLSAMATKDIAEVEHIRTIGKITTEVVGLTADFLSSQREKDGLLVKSDGAPLTIAEVKRRINLWLTERGAENPEGTIFAIGRDAAVPHSVGNPQDFLRLGQTIVFDIFPCEAGGGYFYDMTRTWCLGYAPDEAIKIYEDVLVVYNQICSELRPGAISRLYQERACELFKQRGHPTQKDDFQTQEGFNHGLGHGVGLQIHQRPFFSLFSDDSQRLDTGVVVTVEPGLYYPDRRVATRIEDTLWLRPDGVFEVLAPYPYDLVLPIRGS